jgi:hypothetical protein
VGMEKGSTGYGSSGYGRGIKWRWKWERVEIRSGNEWRLEVGKIGDGRGIEYRRD